MNPRLRFKRDDGTDYPDWEEKKLGEITEDIRGGFAFPINEQGKKTGELPFYKVSDMNHFNNQLYMNIAENNIDFNTARKLKCNPAPKDTIIFPKLGMAIKTNKKRILSKTSCYDNNIFGLIVNNKYLIPKFLYYSFVKLDLMDLAEMGNTIPSIRKSALENFVIKIPCLEEQNKIADFLSYIDEVILASNQEVKKLQELKKGAMQKIFSQKVRFKRDDGTDYPDWEEKKFNDVFDCFEYGLNASATKYDGKNKYIRITDIDEEARTYSYNDVVSPNCELDDKYLVKENDILFARTGASVGKTYLYRKSDGILYFAGFLIRGHVNQKFDSRFIFQSTLSEEFKIWIKVNSVRTGQPGINSQQYASYKLHIPYLEEQQKIGDFLSDFDEAISLAKQELEKWKLLKKGLLQQMFV